MKGLQRSVSQGWWLEQRCEEEGRGDLDIYRELKAGRDRTKQT